MAETIQNKIYKTTINGMPSAMIAPGYNTPYSYQETDYAGLGQTALALGDYYKSELDKFTQRGSTSDYDRTWAEYNAKYGGDTAYNAYKSGQYDPTAIAKLFNIDANQLSPFATGGFSNSGYVRDPNTGNMTTQSALDGDAYWKAEVAAGRARPVQVGSGISYVPIGTAADLQLQGQSYDQQLATPSVQQQIQQQGLQPVNPATQPQAQTQAQPGQFTGTLPNGETATFLSAEIARQYGATQVQPTVPVRLNPSTTTNTDALNAQPTTGLDIQSMMQGLTPSQQQVMAASQPTAREQEINKMLANLETGLLQGTVNIDGQAIPTPLIGRQSQKLREDIAFQQAPLLKELGILTSNRENILKALTMAEEFGIQNRQLAQQAAQVAREEQDAARDFAISTEIQTPYYLLAGTVYSSNGQVPFTSEQDFQQRTGMTLQQAGAQGMITSVDQQYLQALALRQTAARRTSTSSNRSPNSDFTDTQLAKGAANSGLAIEDFSQLSEDEQNYFINGEVGSRLDNGRLTQDDYDDIADEIDNMFADGTSAADIQDFLLSLGIPAEDRYDLEDYVKDNSPKGGLNDTGLWSSSQGDKWYNPLGWFQ